MIIATLIIAAGIAGGMGMEDFRDEFAGSGLNARWTWRTPVEGPTALPGPNGLSITVPQRAEGFDLWTGRYDAPLLTTPVGEGDFDYEGRIALSGPSPDSHFHVGLAVGFGDRHVLCWGLYQSARYAPPAEPRVWLEATGQGGLLKGTEAVRECELRIEKRGYDYALFWRPADGGDWRRAGSYHSLFPARFVGVMPKTFGDGPAVTAQVRYLDLKMREGKPQALRATAHVDPSRVEREINPNIYGHFIEHLGRCIQGGIWAEILTNRKFAGEGSNRGALQGWEPFNPGPGVEVVRDNVTYYTGEQCQRVTFRGNEGERGIAQGGLDLRPGKHPCRLVARGRGLTGPVRVAIRRGGEVLASHDIPALPDEWRTYRFTLDLPAAANGASFTITSAGRDGTVWLGCVSLMPEDNVDGMRKDVLEAIRLMKPPVIRWPGGNFVSGYHWRDGIGDPDKRPARHDRAWDALEMNDFGTDEFLRFCDLVGTTPYICTNAGEALPDEAADWVRYCHAPSSDPVGRLRAENGRPEPYDVPFWGIGNEMYGGWQLGFLSPTNYARKAVDFAKAMRAVDKDVKLIAVGVDGAGWNDWNRTIVREAGEHFDMLSCHFYQGAAVKDDPSVSYQVVIGALPRVERMLRETVRIVRENEPAGKTIPIAFDEWNVWPDDASGNVLESDYLLRDGLFAAGIFHILHRLADDVRMANLAQLVNVLGALRTSQTEVLRTPIALAFEMYAEYAGTKVVASRTEGAEGLLDLSATLSDDGRTLYVAAINLHPSQAIEMSLDLTAAPRGDATLVRMNGPSFASGNRLGAPPDVTVTREKLSADEVHRPVLPPHSVGILVFRLD